MKIVLDTNVLVSGLLRAASPPGWIVRRVATGEISLCHDDRILEEYRDVLTRERFGFAPPSVAALLEQIVHWGHTTEPHPLPHPLPDRDDEAFLEVALGGGARCLVTGNLKHFPGDLRQGVEVLTPAEFLDFYRQAQSL